MGLWNWFGGSKVKENPAQPAIAAEEGDYSHTSQTKIQSVQKAYEIIEVVNRCINILVDNASMVDFDIKDNLAFTGLRPNQRPKKLSLLLNSRPNPYMDINTFRRLLFMDFFVEGNFFIHYDGESFYHLPAINMTINTDTRGYVHSYTYEGEQDTDFAPNEIIHVKDNSINSVYRGDSRILSAMETLYTREFMIDFQNSYFKNGTSIGIILETPEVLGKKMKDRQELEWMQKYNPTRGNGRPMILDQGMKANQVTNTSFRDMAFNDTIVELEKKTAMALGVPPILLDSGNNANIKPNIELMFNLTIIPVVRRFEAALEYFFGVDVQMSTHRIPALRPDLKDEAERLSALVNNGILTGNEARIKMREEPLDDPVMDEIRIPANIAGSATGVEGQEGGAPTIDEDNN